jgi:hypothetical protein
MTKEEYLQSKIDQIKKANSDNKMRVKRFAKVIVGMSLDQILAEFTLIQNKESDLSFAERSFINRLCIEALMFEARAKKEEKKKAEIETEEPKDVVN